MFSLESPYRGDSNEYTQYTLFNEKKENQPKLSQETQEEFLTAVVNEPSVFEPLKFYCICIDDNCTWYYQKEDYAGTEWTLKTYNLCVASRYGNILFTNISNMVLVSLENLCQRFSKVPYKLFGTYENLQLKFLTEKDTCFQKKKKKNDNKRN